MLNQPVHAREEAGIGAGELAQWVNVPVTKPDDLSWSPTGGRRELTLAGCPLTSHVGCSTPPQTNKQMRKGKEIQFLQKVRSDITVMGVTRAEVRHTGYSKSQSHLGSTVDGELGSSEGGPETP